MSVDVGTNDRFKAAVSVLSAEVGCERVLLDSATGNYYSLNSVGSCIWEALSESRTLATVLDVVALRFADVDASSGDVIEQVTRFLADLEASGLIQRA